MRVGISGAHGTGKTTLAEALCEHLPGHVVVDEPYYLLEEEGYEFGFPPSLEDYRAMLARSVQSMTSPLSAAGVVLTGHHWTTSRTWPRSAPIPRARPEPQGSGPPLRALTC
ncbi:AAA family ATPase [Nonomuraea sp. NPDC049607]|uniref:AAA family ATPase n=1 Tax=Nonomuraea sp. NPDC049607 TaxID=3154732 RepID=UPI0034495AD4